MNSHWMKCAVLGTALALGTPVVMAQGSAAFAPTTQLAGQTLQLNGQGVRYRTVIPVYEMGLSLVRGMRENADPAHAIAVAGYMDKLGRIFSTEKKIAAGQAFALEHVPGKGTVFLINGVQKGETVTDAGFIEAVLRIWVGPKPADSQLKSSLLGAPPKKVDTNNLG